MFVHPNQCCNGLNCHGLAALGRLDRRRRPPFINTGDNSASNVVCAYCAVASALSGGTFPALDVSAHNNSVLASLAFTTNLTDKQLSDVFGPISLPETRASDPGFAARIKRSNFKIITHDNSLSSVNSSAVTQTELLVDNAFKRQYEAAREANISASKERRLAKKLDKPFFECQKTYITAYKQFVPNINALSGNYIKGSSGISSDALAGVIATLLVAGHNVVIENGFVNEESAFLATKKAVALLGAKSILAKNIKKRSIDYYLSEETGLPLATRWNRSSAAEFASDLVVKIARFGNGESLPNEANNMLFDDADDLSVETGGSGKNVRFVFSGVDLSAVPSRGAVVLSFGTYSVSYLAKFLSDSRVFVSRQHVEDAGRILEFCINQNPKKQGQTNESQKASLANLDSLRSKILTSSASVVTASPCEAGLDSVLTQSSALIESCSDSNRMTKPGDLVHGLTIAMGAYLRHYAGLGLTLEAIRALRSGWESLRIQVRKGALQNNPAIISAVDQISTLLQEEEHDLAAVRLSNQAAS